MTQAASFAARGNCHPPPQTCEIFLDLRDTLDLDTFPNKRIKIRGFKSVTHTYISFNSLTEEVTAMILVTPHIRARVSLQ